MPKLAAPATDIPQAELIRRLRELLRPTPVKTGRIPVWLKRRLLKAVQELHREGRIGAMPYAGDSGGFLLNAVRVQTSKGPDLDHRWLDHWGTTRMLDGYELFAAEPYGIEPEAMQAVVNFAELLDLDFRISANSWHYPGSTVRIEFWPKEGGGGKGLTLVKGNAG